VSFESSVLTGAGEGTEGSTNGREAGSESRTVGMRKGDESEGWNGKRWMVPVSGMTTAAAGKKYRPPPTA